VSAGKWFEYMLLAPAVPLLLRRRADVQLLLWTIALWSAAATFVGVLQFFGTPIAAKGTIGHRQASFLGSSDFAALSGAALLAGVLVLLLDRKRGSPLGWLLVGAGLVGTVLAGALAAIFGLATSLLAVVLVLGRRGGRVLVAWLLAVAVVASLAIRAGDLTSFSRFLRDDRSHAASGRKIQTYAQHTLLAYIGLRIFERHPALGVGWLGSNDPYAFEPYLADARKRFPNASPLAFPSRQRRWGVQNLYIQALADLGVPGLLAVVAVFATTIATATRAFRRGGGLTAAFALTWTLLVVWLWAAQSFVAGIPLDALTWVAVGLAATAAARVAPGSPDA
jgi:O-antigen ligase